ncbi:DUF6496 domain-containing protein [Corallococcus interemptor]|uniref:DUF6496 domain-containing protein n=2 Tax=Corallococcus TaxID=83461 RepID=UPI001F26E1E7|nr:DUF6496 domain-containing protein [Corallococcus interemptor]
MEHIREGEHGARSTKQAIAIGLSKARRAGVPLKTPKKEQASARTRRSAKQDLEVGQKERKPPSRHCPHRPRPLHGSARALDIPVAPRPTRSSKTCPTVGQVFSVRLRRAWSVWAPRVGSVRASGPCG